MQVRAIFQRKEASFEPSECEIEKVIHLSDSDFAQFQQTLLDNYDFLRENADLMRVENGITHCLLVVGETFEDGILVNSEGSSYARYAAYFPNAKQFLLTQGQAQQESSSAAIQVSPALLAYGEKMGRIVDASIKRALSGHDQSTYILSMTELRSLHDQDGFDEELFAAMLQERPEILDMDVDEGGDIMVTLSLEAVMAYDLSKYRVLTQDELDVIKNPQSVTEQEFLRAASKIQGVTPAYVLFMLQYQCWCPTHHCIPIHKEVGYGRYERTVFITDHTGNRRHA